MEDLEEKYKNMREHVRIDVKVPFSVRLLSDEEKQNIISTVIGHYKFDIISLKESSDKTLTEWLNTINKKLDSIISLLTIQQHGFHELPLSLINISGGGLSFLSEKMFQRGDILEIKLLLDIPIPLGLYLYGEVIRSEKKNNNFDVAVKFIKINEEIRDCIIRYVLYKEKQIISQTKGISERI